MITKIKMHGRLALLDGMQLSPTADGQFPENPELNTIHTVGPTMYVYTEIAGYRTWFPLAGNSETATYLHVQADARTSWTINHGLNTQDVWFIIKDENGDIVQTPLDYILSPTDPTNSFTLTFSEPIKGTVFVVGSKAFSTARLNASVISIGGTFELNSTGIVVGNKVIDVTQLPTLNEINAIIADLNTQVDGNIADLTTQMNAADANLATQIDTAIAGVVDNAPTQGNTLSKLYSLIASMQDVLTVDDLNLDTLQEIVTRLKSNTLSITEQATQLAVLDVALDGVDAATVKLSSLLSNGGNVVDLVNGLIPAVVLPSFVDDVIDVANFASLPTVGESGKIYSTVAERKIYRWSGSTYVEISPAPGSTDAVPEGSVNLYFTAARARAAVTDIIGNAGTATKLQTARSIALTGDISGSANFDGSSNVNINATLPDSGASAGTYGDGVTVPVVVVNQKGLIVGISTATIRQGTTSQTGLLQLIDSVTSISTSAAATPNSVKQAYDLANTAKTTADAAIPSSQKGAINGVATLNTSGIVPSVQLPTNSPTASTLQTARQIAIAGDASGGAMFDGSGNVSISVALGATGVTPGTYAVVTLDAKGRATSARALQASDLPAGTANTGVSQQWTKGQSATPIALTYGATVAMDMSLSNNFSLSLTGNAILGLPTNIQPGQSGVIAVSQDASGGRTLGFNSVFKFANATAPVLSTAPSAVDYLCYYVESATRIFVSIVKNVG